MKKRIIVYSLIMLFGLISVLVKAQTIKKEDKQAIVSVFNEWQKNGKPVDVVELARGTLYKRQSISGVMSTSGIIEADVNEAVASLLRIGQACCFNRDDQQCEGRITYISPEKNLISGLYTVQLRSNALKDIVPGSILVAEIVVSQYPQTLYIPTTAVLTDAEGSFCWVVVDGKAKKSRISIGVSNGRYVQVVRGLKPRDVVCINGTEKIEAGEKVFIRKRESIE